MVRAGIVPDGFDMSVYKEEGARQLFRGPGMSKDGEDRPFRFIVKQGDSWGSADIWKCDVETRKK
jgi:hypothetical protein